MTEIPEHLLRRSRERRTALGGAEGGDGEGSAEAAPAAPAAAASAAPAVVESSAAPTAPAEATAPAVVDEAPSPTYLTEQAVRRSRIPIWAAPVLVLLPFWAILYAGAFGDRGKPAQVDPLVLGQQIYTSKGCSGCHGAAGEGGVGPALKDGDAKITFPNVDDHITWVKEGSQSKPKGTPYGDPNRPGGQRHVVS
ncbi:MAG TPA: c-type cytochrome, partial [Acidimicrobiales bacterium]|nr:c-type cytochrome [Acidimicrobiales bacterium]